MNQTIRTLEAEVSQLHERLGGAKRQIDGYDKEIREHKRMRVSYGDCQKQIIKTTTELEYVRADRDDLMRTTNLKNAEVGELTQKLMETDKRLAVEVAKASLNS